MTAPVQRPDEVLLQASSLAAVLIRFADGAAHPSRAYQPPDSPHLSRDVYVFAPSPRKVPTGELPAFLATLPSPAMLMSTTTRGIVALLLLDELSDERAASARHVFANQRAGVDILARQLGLTAESQVLLEVNDEAHVVSLPALQLWSERFAVDIGWSLAPLDDDPRASARIHLFRSDGVNAPPRKPGSLLITSDVPVIHHTAADMVLAALRRHVPAVMDRAMDANPVRVWLMLDENGSLEQTALSVEPRSDSCTTFAAALLEPFAGESLTAFESVGTIFIPDGFGPNTISVWWLQRRNGVMPDVENGVYQFDAQRLLPPRSTLEEVVRERFPEYARVGLTELADLPRRNPNAPFDPTPDECIVPWFIVSDDDTVLESWLWPYLQNPLIARQMIENRFPDFRFATVRMGDIRTTNGSWPPIVWATLDPASPRP